MNINIGDVIAVKNSINNSLYEYRKLVINKIKINYSFSKYKYIVLIDKNSKTFISNNGSLQVELTNEACSTYDIIDLKYKNKWAIALYDKAILKKQYKYCLKDEI